MAVSAGLMAAVLSSLTGCAPDRPAELAQPTPFDGLTAIASYELEPVESRRATEDEIGAARAAWSDADAAGLEPDGIPGTGALLDEDGARFRVLRIDGGSPECSSVPALVEVMGDAGIRITYEREGWSSCLAMGFFVVDEFELPREVTGTPITVEIVDDVRLRFAMS